MLDLLFLGCHSFPDATGEIYARMQQNKLDVSGISFVSSQDTRMATELVESMSMLSGYRVDSLLHFKDSLGRFDRLLRQGIRYVAMLTRYYHSVFEYLDIIQFIRKVSTEAKIIIGGGFLLSAVNKLESREKEALLELLQADIYICQDNCSSVLPRILKTGGAAFELAQIPHIIWRQRDGNYRASEAINKGEKQNLILPDWKLYPSFVKEITSLNTTISCPFSCSFCAVKNKTDSFRVLSLETIRQNIQYLMDIKRTRLLHFTDETINLPKERFQAFLEMLIELDSGMQWYSFCRCEYMDDKTARLMKKSGCIAVLLGLESGNDQQLNRMNKQVTVQKLRETHRLYQEHGIVTIGFFVIGFPGETDQSLEDTVHFIEDCHPDFYRLHVWECETSTRIWESRQSVGLTLKNGVWCHSTMNMKQATQHIATIQTRIQNSVSIDKADFSFALQMLNHGHSLEEVKKLYRYLNVVDGKGPL